MSKVKFQKSNIRSQISDVRCQRSEVRSQRSEVRCQMSDKNRYVDRYSLPKKFKQMSDVRCQVSDVTSVPRNLKPLNCLPRTTHFKCLSNVYFSNLLQIFFKCLANFSFFVNIRHKLIHSLAAFPLINISIVINHYFSGAPAATQKVSGITKSSRYLVIAYMQNII